MDYTNILQTGIDIAMDGYLSINQTAWGVPIHFAAILATGFLIGPKKKAHKSLVDLIQISVSDLIPNKALNVINDLWDDFRDPNLEGIVISSPSISVSRDADVSENPVLFAEGYTKANLIDNCTPHPREWNIDGYLTGISQLDGGLTIKPSLMIQQSMLDAFMRSRRPLWFKTADMEFVRVLISHMQIEETAEASNVRKISLTLKEWDVINMTTSMSDIVNMALGG